jgi:hypothetical protein
VVRSCCFFSCWESWSMMACCCWSCSVRLLTRFCQLSTSWRRAFSIFLWLSVAILLSVLNQIFSLIATPTRPWFLFATASSSYWEVTSVGSGK